MPLLTTGVGKYAAAAAGGGAEPDDIAGLFMWQRAGSGTYQDAGTTPAVSDDDPVGRWADLSGNGRHFNQTQISTPNYRPNLQTGVLNGQSVLNFVPEGEGLGIDYFNGPDCSSLTAAEVFLVARIASDPGTSAGYQGMWDFGTSGNACLFPYYADGVIYDDFGSTVRKGTADPTPSLTAWNLYSVRSASGAWSNYLNGTQLYTTATNTVGFRSATFLGANFDINCQFIGDIAEFILYDHVLSSGDRTSVHDYIETRYALTIA